jgi:hypothetical protein
MAGSVQDYLGPEIALEKDHAKRKLFPYFWSIDRGLIYSHLQNSTTARDNPAKLGMVVGKRMLVDRDICFLSGGVHKLR